MILPSPFTKASVEPEPETTFRFIPVNSRVEPLRETPVKRVLRSFTSVVNVELALSRVEILPSCDPMLLSAVVTRPSRFDRAVSCVVWLVCKAEMAVS